MGTCQKKTEMIEESYFQKLNRMEEENFQRNRASYPEYIMLLEDCEGLYRLLINDLIDLGPATKDEAYLGQAMKVCSDIPNELSLAALNLLREHIDDSDFHIRKAIELFGFVVLMSKSEEDTLKWCKAAESEEAYKEFKTAFATRKILPKGIPEMDLLYEEYDRSTKRTHSSIFSVQSHLVESKVQGGSDIKGGVFTPLTALEFKQHAVGIATIHCLILTILPKNFEKFLRKEIIEEFNKRLGGLHEKIVPFNQKLNRELGL